MHPPQNSFLGELNSAGGHFVGLSACTLNVTYLRDGVARGVMVRACVRPRAEKNGGGRNL